MKKKEVNAYKKMTPEQLAAFLALRRRGGIVPAKKGKGSYNRQEQKKMERERQKMFVYIVIEDSLDDSSEICGVYSNSISAANKKFELETKNRYPAFFSYRIEKFPIWD